jgi:hypothetical protein
MRRTALLLGALIALSAAAVASAHELELFDHPVPARSSTTPPSPVVLAGGDDAEWEMVGTIPTGNPHSDLDFFTVAGDTYMSAGTLGVGPNAGGQNIFRLTEGGVVKPTFVSGHPSAACPGVFTSATGLQHDVEATPKGDAFQQQANPFVAKGDAQLLVDATDASGRCHDNGNFGAGAPNGGLEYIDVTDPKAPKEIALTTHIGNAHTVNVDPKRPHIAFDITQDGVSMCAATNKPTNEAICPSPTAPGPLAAQSNALDGFEVIDMSSCMYFPAGTTIAQKRERCAPQVFRYRYPDGKKMAASHVYPNNWQSCHEVEIYPDDRLACASITSTILFDLKGAFDDNGTPGNYLDDKPRGTPLPCKKRPSTSPDGGGLKTGAPVFDCVNGERNGQAQKLNVEEWLKIGAPSLEGVEWLGTVPHMGFDTTQNIVNTPFDAPRDLVAAHESEISNSGRFVITSDERGGGVVPGGASCSSDGQGAPDYARGNGGLHFFPTGSFTKNVPLKTEQAHALWAKTKDGKPAVYRAPIRTQPQATICTAHVFQQIPGQNRIFMGYYSQGTQVLDFTENADGTVTFKDSGYFIPQNANTWVSHIFKAQRNADGTFTYWGAASDGILPGSGRGAIDVYKVTMPAPPTPAGQRQAGTPDFPLSRIRGIENQAPPQSCTGTSAFEETSVRGRGRRLTFNFVNRGPAAVGVELFRESRGRRIVEQRVGRARAGSRTFRFTRRITDGHYYARFSTRAANGGADVRRVPLLRRGGRWIVLKPFYRREACALIPSAKLSRSVFGGARRNQLGIAFRLGQASNVSVEVRQGGRLLQRFGRRGYPAARTIRLRTRGGKRVRRGEVRVIIRAERQRPGRAQTVELTARRL